MDVQTESTLYEQLGGEQVLRAIIDRFVDRVTTDTMIGFLFANVDRERLKAREFEFAARHLGASIEYTGRALDRVHRRHRILGGHFMRRLQILKETLVEFETPDHIVAHWVAHTESLRPLITDYAGSQCDDIDVASKRS
ncbi:MAG TPA: group 1 truncated hemoglobin [Polyangiaceae bacterium]